MTKQECMQKIRELSFSKWETALYLDTHPENAAAMEYYREMKAKLNALVAEYEAEYSPITQDGVQGPMWTWLDGPWPWQDEADCSSLDCHGTKE